MLVITLGDPYSVNVELAARWLLAGLHAGGALPGDGRLTLVGSLAHWRDQLRRLGLVLPVEVAPVARFADVEPGRPAFLDIDPQAGPTPAPAERLDARSRGRIAVAALEALRGAPTASRLAVVTAPIDKAACHAAGFAFPGHTEFFEALWRTQAVMTLAGPRLVVGLVTNHLALAAVPAALTVELVAAKLLLLVATLRRDLGRPAARVAVVGLNPHAGDGGLFGDEEERVLRPAIARAAAELRARGESPAISGPLPADTAFYRCYRGDFDGVLAMYHDQGLGPLKTVHFDDAVNLSGGLPHLRASPDHGPAADLFLTGRASGASFAAAMRLADAYLRGSP